MAKAKKERTPEQIAAAKERMAKVRAARQNKNPETKKDNLNTLDATAILGVQNDALPESTEPVHLDGVFEPQVPGPEPTGVVTETLDQPDVGELMRQIQELKAYMFDQSRQAFAPPVANSGSVQNGKLTGTVDKYSMDKTLYDDPRARLAKEPKLARFAFDLNYELEWEIGESQYETIDHVRQREPKFTLTLVKIMLDEDTGEDTNGRYDICRLIMHEDPVAALTIANENGLNVDDMDEVAFLNEMRYIRMRDWLLEAFYPSRQTVSKQKRDMVINGKLVSYWEKGVEVDSGEGGIKKVDWDNLSKVKF